MAKKVETAGFDFSPEMVKAVTSDGASISAMIKAIARQNKNLQNKIAVCAASCVLHAIEHRNVSLGTQLVNSLEGWRTNTLKEWFIEYGPFIWEKDPETNKSGFRLNKERVEVLKEIYKKDKPKFHAHLLEKPFWVYKPEPEFKGFDLLGAVMQAIRKAEKIRDDKDEAKRNHEDNDFTGLAELKRFVKAMRAEEEAETVTEAEFDEVETVRELQAA